MSSITHSLKINGMSCGGCSTRLESVLASTRGVIKAEISHQENSGVIITDENIDETLLGYFEKHFDGIFNLEFSSNFID